MSERLSPERPRMTEAQETALRDTCERYNTQFRHEDYAPTFDLPENWVAGWVGGYEIQQEHPTIFIGCDPEGHISS